MGAGQCRLLCMDYDDVECAGADAGSVRVGMQFQVVAGEYLHEVEFVFIDLDRTAGSARPTAACRVVRTPLWLEVSSDLTEFGGGRAKYSEVCLHVGIL